MVTIAENAMVVHQEVETLIVTTEEIKHFTEQSVVSVVTTVRYPFDQQEESQCFAEIVLEKAMTLAQTSVLKRNDLIEQVDSTLQGVDQTTRMLFVSSRSSTQKWMHS